MKLENGMRVVVHGRCEDCTDHLDGTTVTIRNCTLDDPIYIEVYDAEGCTWFVRAEDVTPCED